MMFPSIFIPLAMMGAPSADGSAAQQSGSFMLVWIGLMIALFYFMLIRPQKRREKERQSLLSGVKSGDRIIFSGGIMGVVANVKEKTLIVKVADNCKVEILRGAVAQVLERGETLAEPPAA